MFIYNYFSGKTPEQQPPVEDKEEKLIDTPVPPTTPRVLSPEEAPQIPQGYFGGLYNMGANAVSYTADVLRQGAGVTYEKATTIGAFAGKKFGEGLLEATKWALFSPENQEEYKETLSRISGNDHLSHVIDTLTPALIHSALEEGKKGYPQLKPIIDHEEKFIENLAKTILLRIVSNTALDVEKKALIGAKEPVQIPNLTLAVLGDIAGVFKKNFELIDPQYKKIQSIEDENERQQALNELFAPLADELLSIGFPNGAADLKINSYLQDYAFNYMKNSLVGYVQTIYAESSKPAHHEESDLLVFNKEGGQALKALTALIAEKGVEAVKKACAQNKDKIIGFLDAYIIGDDATIVKAHLAKELEILAESNDPHLEWIWSILHNNLESFSIRVLSHLAETSPHEDKSVTTKALKNLIDITVSFFADKGISFDQELARIESLPTKEEIAAEKKKLFQPFINEFLHKTGLEGDPLIEKIKEDQLPALIEVLYKEGISIFPSQKNEKGELEHSLINLNVLDLLKQTPKVSLNTENSSLETVAALIDETDELELIPNLLEAEHEASELEKGCAFLAKDAKAAILSYINDNRAEIAKAVSGFLGQDGTTLAGRELADAFASVITSNDQNTQKALDFAESTLKTSLFKVLSLVIENTKGQAEQDTSQEAFANSLHRIVALLSNKIPAIDAEIRAIRNSSELSDEEKTKAINLLFAPVVDEFLAMGGLNEDGSYKIADILPISAGLKPFAIKALQTSILPSIISKVYLELTAVHHQMESNEDELARMVSSAPEGVQKITEYVRKFVPFYLKNNADKITDLVMEKGGKYFDLLGTEEKARIESLLSRNITVASTNENMDPVWQAVATFAQGFITKAFLGSAKNLETAENYGKTAKTNPLLINLLLGSMATTEGHFKRITSLQTQGADKKAHKKSHGELLQHFHVNDELHPALIADLDPNATVEEKKNQRLEHFFKPFAKNLVALSGMDNVEDFPLPEPMKKAGMKMFQEVILPEVLMGIYNEVLKPQNVNKIMTNVISKLEGATDAFSSDSNMPLDPQQRELNMQIGTFIKSFITMMPEASNTLFSVKEINKTSTEKLGDIIRKKTNATTLLDVANSLLAGINIKAPDVNDPRTQKEIDDENRKVSKELQSRLTTFISNQAKKTVRNNITEKWDNFQKAFDEGVEKYLGAPGKAVKSFLDWVFGGVMRFFLPVLNFVLFSVIWPLVELHIWNKAGEAIGNAKMPIHENLAFNLTEKAIDTVKNQLEASKREQEEKVAAINEQQRKELEHAERIRREILLAQTQNVTR